MCNKIGYPSRADALEHARIIRASNRKFSRRRAHGDTGKKFRAYECRDCGCWHLTTKKPKHYAKCVVDSGVSTG